MSFLLSCLVHSRSRKPECIKRIPSSLFCKNFIGSKIEQTLGRMHKVMGYRRGKLESKGCKTCIELYYYYYYYYYTIWMSLVTGLFFLVLLLNQQ
jgi:hypothetical protein